MFFEESKIFVKKKIREEFRKHDSWKWRMGNFWSEEFDLNKTSQKEPDKLDWTKSIHHGPKQINVWNIFFQ